MNTEQRKKVNNGFKKDFLKLINNSLFGKTMQNFVKHRDITLVVTKKKKLFIVQTKLTHNKMVFRKSTGNRNE